MKNSGVEWIGEIPEDWEVKRGKELFFEINDRCKNPENYPLLSVSEYYGVAPKSEKIEEGDFITHAETLDGYKICQKGDIVQNIMLAWKRATGMSNYEGLISPAYCIYRPYKGIDSKYYHYLFRTDVYADLFKQYSTGIIDSRLRLYPAKFLSLKYAYPPKEIQQRIATYLDKKCSKIEETIQNQQQVIEKLKAYKQSLITEAVTGKVKIENGKACGKYESYKESGVEWIGKIPSKWISTRVGHLYKSMLGKMVCPNQLTEEHSLQKYLCAMNVHFDGVDLSEIKEMWFTSNEMNQYQVRNGDLLVVEGGAGAGGASIVYCLSENDKIFIQNSIHLVKPVKTNYLPKYLYYWIYSLVKQNYIDYTCNKATIPHFTKEKLEGMPIAISDKITQQEIIFYLDKKCTAIDTAIEQKQNLIEKLTEYKKSLIYEVVTGKRDIK